MKNLKFKYRSFSKAVVILILFVFSFSTFASDCYNCVCSAKQEVKKEMKCCTMKKEMKCCSSKENNCEMPKKKDCKDCNKCVVKKSDIENPITTNENKISGSKILLISDINLSLNPVNSGMFTFNTFRPPDKTCKIFLTLSNFRI